MLSSANHPSYNTIIFKVLKLQFRSQDQGTEGVCCCCNRYLNSHICPQYQETIEITHNTKSNNIWKLSLLPAIYHYQETIHIIKSHNLIKLSKQPAIPCSTISRNYRNCLQFPTIKKMLRLSRNRQQQFKTLITFKLKTISSPFLINLPKQFQPHIQNLGIHLAVKKFIQSLT